MGLLNIIDVRTVDVSFVLMPIEPTTGSSKERLPMPKLDTTNIYKDEILAALPNLNRADLEAVKAITISLLGGRVSNVSNGATTAPETIFEALTAAISRPMPYSSLPPALVKHYEANFPSLIIFFNKYFKGWDSNKITQTGFLRMIFGLIAYDLKERGATPSVGALIYNLPRIYEIVDNAFPDYLKSNMGHMILKMFKKKSI